MMHLDSQLRMTVTATYRFVIGGSYFFETNIRVIFQIKEKKCEEYLLFRWNCKTLMALSLVNGNEDRKQVNIFPFLLNHKPQSMKITTIALLA